MFRTIEIIYIFILHTFLMSINLKAINFKFYSDILFGRSLCHHVKSMSINNFLSGTNKIT